MIYHKMESTDMHDVTDQKPVTTKNYVVKGDGDYFHAIRITAYHNSLFADRVHSVEVVSPHIAQLTGKSEGAEYIGGEFPDKRGKLIATLIEQYKPHAKEIRVQYRHHYE